MRIEHWFYTLPLRLRSLFRRRRVERDLDDELQDHLDHKTSEFLAQGLPPLQARRAALRAMDGLTQRKEQCREARRVGFIEDTIDDIRYGIRVLKKSPGFTAVAALTLALAIGANAVVFGVANRLILHPLGLPHAESLYGLQRPTFFGRLSYPDYADLRDRNRSFESLAGYGVASVGLDTGDTSTRAWLLEATGNYFDALGVQPYLGKFFHASDEHGPDSAPYLVLSYGYWHSHFQDDRNVVGRVVRLNKHPFTIIGVTPPDFQGAILFFFPAGYVPLVDQEQMDGVNLLDSRANNRSVFQALGRLKPGVTPAQAVADLNSIGNYLEKTYPKEDSQMTFQLAPPGLYGDYLGRPVRAFLAALTLLAGLILLAACANLGSLFAARASDRAREVALRLALGSSRSRILRTLLTEAVLISLLGGVAGLIGSKVLLDWLSVWQPVPRFPIHLLLAPDGNVYAFALVVALLSGLLFGIVPVRQVMRTDPYQVVKAGTRVIGGRRVTLRDLLLVGQIAICAVLVTASMVAVRGMTRSMDARLGFEPANVMLADTDLVMAGYNGDAVPAMQKRMMDAVAAIPGVTSVGLTDQPPLGEDGKAPVVFAEQTTDLRPANALGRAMSYNISPEYFRAAGTVLLAGRAIDWHDDRNAPRVSVVNQEFARKIFGSVPGAVGHYFKLRDGTRVQVAGVVEDGKYGSLTEDSEMAMFHPLMQSPSSVTWLIVRSNREPRQMAAILRKTLRNLDQSLPVTIQTWSQEMDSAWFAARVATVSLGVLGLMGAVLAVSGIFGMAAYSVSKRLRELGIRMALGARRSEVLQAGLGRAVKLLAIGSVLGLILGMLSARVLAAVVFQATPRDPMVLGGVVLAMMMLGLLATWIPAQRALSLDPSTLLREE